MLQISESKYKELNAETVGEFILNYLKAEAPTTYYKNKEVQCGRRKNRSIEDLISLGLFYFPDLKEEDIIVPLMKEAVNENIRMLYCPDIKR